MSQIKFKVHTGLNVKFKLEKFNSDGVIQETGWFKNTILENGLNMLYDTRLFFTSSTRIGLMEYCNIGTGTSTPAVSQTGLDNYYDQVRIGDHGNELLNTTYDNPYRKITNISYQFNIGLFSGQNISEVGLSRDSYDSDVEDAENYFNRQLVRTTSTVQDEELHEGDGSQTEFSGALDAGSCDPDTVVISAYDTDDNLMILEDQGDGTFSGDGSGTILYDTGGYSITFNNPVGDGYKVHANYEWQEATVITVLEDEGLRVYAQVIQYFELQPEEEVQESFTFEDLTEETSQTIDVTKKQFYDIDGAFPGWSTGSDCPSTMNIVVIAPDAIPTDMTSNFGTDNEGETCHNDSISRNLTSYAAGGPKATITGTWNPGSIDFDIGAVAVGSITLTTFRYERFVSYLFILDSPITDILDTEEIKFTVEYTWGEV